MLLISNDINLTFKQTKQTFELLKTQRYLQNVTRQAIKQDSSIVLPHAGFTPLMVLCVTCVDCGTLYILYSDSLFRLDPDVMHTGMGWGGAWHVTRASRLTIETNSSCVSYVVLFLATSPRMLKCLNVDS